MNSGPGDGLLKGSRREPKGEKGGHEGAVGGGEFLS